MTGLSPAWAELKGLLGLCQSYCGIQNSLHCEQDVAVRGRLKATQLQARANRTI